MKIAISLLIIVATFLFMEFVAWAVHKYIMHGVLWTLHEDHHVVNHDSFFQKNDYFFLIFAIPSIILIFIGHENLTIGFFIGLGIALYGLAYFLIHEVIIHRRLPPPSKTKSKYIKAIRKAHKVHHKNQGKYNGVNFGMLIVPMKYFK
ncbi:MAG: carotene hydroxylase [Flavobacteriales bacterium]|nr:carotene hydroxylase [Flavobacteriales bacterium]MBU46918.1 carotene hydroxylase [Flavobacteriales bacterium]|tara:strand:+ start:4974 stop:5417 length:444 start_codon:yes stop_codon:yes gene_type:complete